MVGHSWAEAMWPSPHRPTKLSERTVARRSDAATTSVITLRRPARPSEVRGFRGTPKAIAPSCALSTERCASAAWRAPWNKAAETMGMTVTNVTCAAGDRNASA